jgi:hypothetical protein
LFISGDQDKKNTIKGHSAIGKRSRKTLLKIVKRNKSYRENSVPSEISVDEPPSCSAKAELFKTTASEILSIMDHLESSFRIR